MVNIQVEGVLNKVTIGRQSKGKGTLQQRSP